MKVGFRIPSFNKRFAARTSLKRVARHSLGIKMPRGYGWVSNPKRALYNRVYSRTTFGLSDLLSLGSSARQRKSKSVVTMSASPKKIMSAVLYGLLFLVNLIVFFTSPWLGAIALVGSLYWIYRRHTSKNNAAIVGSDHVVPTENTQAANSRSEISTKSSKGLRTNFDDDFRELLTLYKQNKREGDIDAVHIIKRVAPEARPSVCPYCRTEFDFTAKRARLCPKCGNKMVVRKGHFLTEEQVEKFEEIFRDHYEKQGVITSLEHHLSYAQDCKLRKEVASMNRALADAFREAAKAFNKRDAQGFSYWDKAWRYYINTRTEEMKKLDRDMLQWSNLPDIMFEMAKVILEQVEYDPSANKKKMLKNALWYMLSSMAESVRFGKEQPYYQTSIYEEAKKIIEALQLTGDEVLQLSEQATQNYKLDAQQKSTYRNYIQEIQTYQLIRSLSPQGE